MSDMPERIWIDHDSAGSKARVQDYSKPPLSSYSGIFTEYTRHDAPLTASEALARCPEVAALYRAAHDLFCENMATGSYLSPSETAIAQAMGPFEKMPAALAPFTKGEDAT